jgi:tetratricopeptide (TPR) repeat protein
VAPSAVSILLESSTQEAALKTVQATVQATAQKTVPEPIVKSPQPSKAQSPPADSSLFRPTEAKLFQSPAPPLFQSPSPRLFQAPAQSLFPLPDQANPSSQFLSPLPSSSSKAGPSLRDISSACYMASVAASVSSSGVSSAVVAFAPPLTKAEETVRALAAATRFTEEGTANLTQGRFNEAERLFSIALNITQAHLGPDNHGVAKSLEMLASFYLTRGNFEEAEPLLKRLYCIRLKQHREGLKSENEFQARENYLLMALTVEKCSSCLEKLGRLSQSESIYLTLLKRQEEYYGREHAFTLDALERLGQFFLRARVYGLAQVVFEKLYETKSKLHGPYSMEVSSVLSSLSLIYSNLELFFDQVVVLERQVFLLDTVHGGSGLSLASALTRLADALSNAAKESNDKDMKERAELIYRRALTIYERHYGPLTPTVVSLRNRLKSLSLELAQ